MVEELIREAIDRFNKKASEDQALAQELAGVRKTVQVEVTDDGTYHFTLENSRVGALAKGETTSPDIRVIASTETLTQLRSGELRAMKAFATRRLQIKGSFEDLLRLRKFF